MTPFSCGLFSKAAPFEFFDNVSKVPAVAFVAFAILLKDLFFILNCKNRVLGLCKLLTLLEQFFGFFFIDFLHLDFAHRFARAFFKFSLQESFLRGLVRCPPRLPALTKKLRSRFFIFSRKKVQFIAFFCKSVKLQLIIFTAHILQPFD